MSFALLSLFNDTVVVTDLGLLLLSLSCILEAAGEKENPPKPGEPDLIGLGVP